jgi:hypothetical protein
VLSIKIKERPRRKYGYFHIYLIKHDFISLPSIPKKKKKGFKATNMNYMDIKIHKFTVKLTFLKIAKFKLLN